MDYSEGAPTRVPGSDRYRKPRLFVMTLRYSRRCFRRVVWRSSQEVWAQLHEQAWRYFGGTASYVVLDNLKEGVIKLDLYEPALNPVYAATQWKLQIGCGRGLNSQARQDEWRGTPPW